MEIAYKILRNKLIYLGWEQKTHLLPADGMNATHNTTATDELPSPKGEGF